MDRRNFLKLMAGTALVTSLPASVVVIRRTEHVWEHHWKPHKTKTFRVELITENLPLSEARLAS